MIFSRTPCLSTETSIQTLKSMRADVTIFLPVYNGANFIRQAIDSVLAQTYTNWTFLIVDNCSTDNTAEICKPYLADARFKYVLNETNLGVHGNFHKALSLCDTPYFAYLSHDDIYVRSDAFEEARSLLEADKSLAMVNAPVRWLDQNSDFIPSFGMSNVGFQGKVAGKTIAKACILNCRNLYGIAVLSRTEFGQKLQLDKRLHQASDVNFFVGIGGERDVYVLQNPAYAIRFHQTNNTLRQYDTLIDEMNIIAQNHSIKLSGFEQLLQKLNAYKVRFGKWVFYKALNLRRRRTAAKAA
ncbi:MAG: glycosyltransferase family 2 protein [Burkholderiaceae bacterium]|nr:glycosyltransferase family 2 protein [Burkholderiaceae bacterium]